MGSIIPKEIKYIIYIKYKNVYNNIYLYYLESINSESLLFTITSTDFKTVCIVPVRQTGDKEYDNV